jgi:hypothetical protein
VSCHLGNLIFYSLAEVQAAFPLGNRPSLESLRRYIRNRELRGRKVGNDWYCTEQALAAFLAGYPVETADAAHAIPLPPL